MKAPRELARAAVGSSLTAGCYFVAARLGLLLAADAQGIAPFWPQSGVALGAVLLAGRKVWPGILVGALLAHRERPAAALALLSIGALAEALVAAELCRRAVRLAAPFSRVSDVFGFASSAAVAALVAATFAALAAEIPRDDAGVHLQMSFGTWWIAEALGMVLIVPLFLILRARPLRRSRPGFQTLEFGLATGALLGCALWGWTIWSGAPSLVYPPLIWLALRFGPIGASLGSALVTVIALCMLNLGVGTLVHLDADHAVLAVQILLASAWLIALVVGTGAAERRATLERLEQTLEAQRTLVDASPAATAALDVLGHVTAWNRAAERLFGAPRAAVLGGPPPVVSPDRELEFQNFCARAACEESVAGFEAGVRRPDGSALEVSISAAPLRDASGHPSGTIAVFEDMTGRRQAEAARARLAAMLEATTDFVSTGDPNGRITYLNRAGRAVVGLSEGEDVSAFTFADLVPDPVLGRWFEEVLPTAERTGVWSGELALRHRDGGSIPVLQVVLGHRDPCGKLEFYSTIARDLRERLEAESALRQTEEQLRQAQKMEAIGRLAGGIAHDFNNLLTILLGAGDLALLKLSRDHPARAEILEIQKAGERAAALTRQLLAFSRKQVSEPRIVDLNGLIRGLDGMLQRVLGEPVQLEQHLSEALGRVRADKGQLEQVVMNLALNARDSMPDGGLLSIETANVELGPGSSVTPSDGFDPAPGSYVRLTVRDTGVGMESETQARIFEPFFTTKGPGKGTGLGLSTVYGIVKQSAGFLSVQSSRGAGTSFSVYLPHVSETGEPVPTQREEPLVRGGSETILLVEDDEAVRELARRVLIAHGYRVLTAPDAETALGVSNEYDGVIQLLLADVIMPGRPGPVLARELGLRRPGLKVMFMSGYTENALTGQSLIDAKSVILAKPFVPRSLVRRVREVLDGPPGRVQPSAPRPQA